MKKFSVFSRKKNNTKTETEEETAVPSAVEPPAEEEVAAASPTTTNEAMSTVAAADQPPPPADHHEDHGDVDEEDDDDEALDVDEAAPKEWDEGGKDPDSSTPWPGRVPGLPVASVRWWDMSSIAAVSSSIADKQYSGHDVSREAM